MLRASPRGWATRTWMRIVKGVHFDDKLVKFSKGPRVFFSARESQQTLQIPEVRLEWMRLGATAGRL